MQCPWLSEIGYNARSLTTSWSTIKTGDEAKEGCELKSGVLIILFVYAVILVVFAIVTFFELFLFSTSTTCSTNSWTFCFPTGDSSAERIRNCTVLEGDVICYQLELNIVTPAGVIGGLFTIINFLTTSLNYRVIKYYCNEENKRRTCLVTLYIVLLFSLLTMLVVCCILGAISRLKNDSPTSDVIVFIFQYVSVILAILLGGFIPMISVLCNWKCTLILRKGIVYTHSKGHYIIHNTHCTVIFLCVNHVLCFCTIKKN